MELSRFSDYSLRVLMYAASRGREKVTLGELTAIYGISQHHLVKIVHYLGKLGYLDNRRGRHGGIWLGRPPSTIVVGEVIRHTETHMNLAECFDPANDFCRLSPGCRLKGVFHEAREAFLHVLDCYTLADLVQHGQLILRPLPFQPAAPPHLPEPDNPIASAALLPSI